MGGCSVLMCMGLITPCPQLSMDLCSWWGLREAIARGASHKRRLGLNPGQGPLELGFLV